MIISCIKCIKKFEINSDLIPENGRLLQCSSCSHQWFFKIDSKQKDMTSVNTDIFDSSIDISIIEKENIKASDNIEDQEYADNNNPINDQRIFKKKEKIKKKNSNILKIILVFLISFTAIVILIDTFKYPISKIIPNIEFILYNLYESIKDIILFSKDLF